MVLEKSDYESREEMRNNASYEEKEREIELKYKRGHHDMMYKILKYNPIDWLNDKYRKFIDRHALTEIEGKVQWWTAYVYIKEVMRRFFGYRVEYPYKNLFPEYGPGILVGNHESHFDPFFMGGAMHRRIRWMSKIENFKTPLVRTLFTNLGAFRLDRDNPDEGWTQAKEILEGGEWVGIFPEGTRAEGHEDELGEFRTGAVRLAIENQVPIVPMAVIGSRSVLPKGKLMVKPARVTVRVGEPITYEDYSIDTITYEELRKLTDELRQEVVDLREGNFHFDDEEEEKQLSIGSPKDVEEKPKSNALMKYAKKFVLDFFQLWDDSWYSLLKILDVFGVKDYFGSFVYHFSGNLVHNFCNIMSPYKCIDYDKYIPAKRETGAIIASNHNSEWDVIILATSFQQRKHYVWQQSKESLFRIPVVNGWVRSCRAFPLKRGGHDVGSYNYALNLLKDGEWVIIYPEGTTNSGGGELLPGHTGPIRLAIEAKVPIYLVGITGTEDVYPKHGKMLNFGQGVILKAGAPFMEHQKYWDKPMPGYDELQNLTDRMMDRISKLLMYDDKRA
ncbi:MAG: 1-acyl-sn-glycerol-3-phosphate acyltransferase [Promethearchaeota archaeon]|nr:MAG: 1-acyl-sn-glycerol-3-phosphate acyltransferase [Candidatus Lokiarchaeota archaeon]